MWRPIPSPRFQRILRPSYCDCSSPTCLDPFVDQSREAVQALGQRPAPDDSAQYIEMQDIHTSGIDCRPLFDPMEHFYGKATTGKGGFTNSVEEDIQVLKENGFIIDYPNGLLGRGCFGAVYRGEYGPNITEMTDTKGQPLRNVAPNMPFAVKLIDFSKIRGWGSYIKEMRTRGSYEIEKEIMTFADHENINPIRMAVNMGEPKKYIFKGTGTKFIQHQRIYLIMDFANLGPLFSLDKSQYYIDRNTGLQSYDRVKLSQDLFWGLKYLHDKQIAHCDVHVGNVLLFMEDTGIVAKWTDFGMGYIGNTEDPEQRPKFYFDERSLDERKQKDCLGFSSVLYVLWRERNRDNEDEYTQELCDQFLEMEKELRVLKDLEQILEKFKAILEWKDRLI